MKLLLLLLLFLLLIYLWRQQRGKTMPAPARKNTGSGAARAPMLACAVCGVHLPPEDAIRGHKGDYCSTAHRQQREG
jgi:uncharacterized protein